MSHHVASGRSKERCFACGLRFARGDAYVRDVWFDGQPRATMTHVICAEAWEVPAEHFDLGDTLPLHYLANGLPNQYDQTPSAAWEAWYAARKELA